MTSENKTIWRPGMPIDPSILEPLGIKATLARLDIARLLAAEPGITNPQIAAQRGTTTRTVKNQMTEMLAAAQTVDPCCDGRYYLAQVLFRLQQGLRDTP